MAVNFKNVLETLKNGITDLAEKNLKDFVAGATADGQAILDGLKNDLQQWTEELAAGQLSKDDFSELVKGEADLLKLVALKQAGLAAIRVDQFKSDVVNLITSTIVGLIP
ncbi:hypothetical protein [Mucilaginibacter aquaedulcis]|jgi:ATP-dependent protease HslVU (ClpYQ) peptidase subunit|uniref:hypothetical protein n=1 Tax=Mucilaginibacter aquaedulcis TaxID=1187081 RepID=UPI0025B30410|nr:hypothetical protein [Mucilaginibacter aquaedulcis]MDN3547690.1 hypothetical protein [Mucilaginibacter aquaedulcis]